MRIISFAMEGSAFIFGSLADPSNLGFIFAFQVLPTIIFFAALMSVLYHIGLMQKIVQAMAWVMLKVMRISGSESLSVAANVFVGQTEAPLVVRPYIARMTESELFTMMVGGMATIAGGVLAAYITMLGGADEAARIFYAKHLLSASIMAAPATIVIAKLLKPEVDESLTKGKVTLEVEKTATNVIEAAANGAADGVRLALECRRHAAGLHCADRDDRLSPWLDRSDFRAAGLGRFAAEPVDDPGISPLATGLGHRRAVAGCRYSRRIDRRESGDQ